MKLKVNSLASSIVVKTIVPPKNGPAAFGVPAYARVMPIHDQQILIESERGILSAKEQGRALAGRLGFSSSELVVIATVISELGRNIVQHAGSGKISVDPIDQGRRSGISITAQDQGPGIPKPALPGLADELFNLRGGGLSGVKRVVDEMEITSEMGRGTSVVVRKWKR